MLEGGELQNLKEVEMFFEYNAFNNLTTVVLRHAILTQKVPSG